MLLTDLMLVLALLCDHKIPVTIVVHEELCNEGSGVKPAIPDLPLPPLPMILRARTAKIVVFSHEFRILCSLREKPFLSASFVTSVLPSV